MYKYIRIEANLTNLVDNNKIKFVKLTSIFNYIDILNNIHIYFYKMQTL